MRINAKLYHINQKGQATPVRGEINYIIEDAGNCITKLIMSTGIVIDIDHKTHELANQEDGNYYTKLKGELY